MKETVTKENLTELLDQSNASGSIDAITLAAVQSAESALKSGAMTFTELDDAGAILMLSERDEMLTINVTAAWLIARLQQRGVAANDAAEFAAHFAIPIEEAAADIRRFFLQLAKSLD